MARNLIVARRGMQVLSWSVLLQSTALLVGGSAVARCRRQHVLHGRARFTNAFLLCDLLD